MKVFIDTSAFLALIFPSESSHVSIVRKYDFYKKEKVRFITSDYILDELQTRCLYIGGSYGASQSVKIISEAISLDQMAVIFVDLTIFKKSQEVFLKYSDHKISFTDATSYVLMKEYSLEEIFTLDRDFKRMRLPTSL